MEFINAKDLPLSGPMAESHGIIVLQDGKLRYMTLAEFQNYMASASVQVDPSLTVGGVAADAAAVGKALRVRNYLINSDFADPVNTNGADQYDLGGAETIDRWIKRNTGVLSIVKKQGIQITSVGEFGGILQTIENGIERLAGKTVTMAAYVLQSPGAYEMLLGNSSNDTTAGTAYGETVFTEPGLVVSSVTLPETFSNGDYLNFFLGEGDTGQTPGSVLEVAWCALYEGEYTAETLPVYIPRGYSLEAAACGAAGGGMSMELIWENQSPTSSFASQTTAMDLSDYDALLIVYRNSTTSSVYTSMILPIGYSMRLLGSASYLMVYRDTTITEDGVKYGSGQSVRTYGSAPTADNTMMIPRTIYGIKGVL